MRWKEIPMLELTDQQVAEFQEVLDDLAKGIRRPEKMQAACERMDRLREANRQIFGEQDLAVELVREARGEAQQTSAAPAALQVGVARGLSFPAAALGEGVAGWGTMQEN